MNTPSKLDLYVILRRATSHDAPQIIAGINSVCAEGGAFYTTRYVATPQWEGVLYRPEEFDDHLLMVAEYNGEVVGAARLFPGGKHTLFNHVAELGIFVLKPFRMQKVGTRLLDSLVNWAAQKHIEKITLLVYKSNKPARRFFLKYGFAQEGRLSRQIKIGNRYTDLLIMRLFLSKL